MVNITIIPVICQAKCRIKINFHLKIICDLIILCLSFLRNCLKMIFAFLKISPKEITLRISEIIWLEDIVDKLQWKHHVSPSEVEQVLSRRPKIFFKEKGKLNPEENLYLALGRSEAGRYLSIFFILKQKNRALIISARDMTISEKKYYEKK